MPIHIPISFHPDSIAREEILEVGVSEVHFICNEFHYQISPSLSWSYILATSFLFCGLSSYSLDAVFCREPAWGTPPVAKVMRKEAWHTQRRDQASGVPLEILKHLPLKPESAYFLLCALTYTSDFTGGCPPLPLSEKRVSLQLQLTIPGCDSVSTYKLLWKSSSLPE